MGVHFNRIIGEYSSGEKGPLLFITAGIHGNEPSGIFALQRVFQTLQQTHPAFRGKLIGVAGNLPALQQKIRFIDRDLNRLWSQTEISRIKALTPSARNTEEQEILGILSVLEKELDKDYTDQVFIDLHTTSAHNGLFSIVTRRKENRELASAIHGPVLFDLSDALSTTTNRYMEEKNIKGIAFEGGQHEDPLSIDNNEAAIWLLMEKAGCLNFEKEEVNLDPYHKQLVVASRFLPHYIRVIYRHDISLEDRFHMHHGFINFHEVYKGEPLARDKDGEIYCPHSGLILMPLYQPQGEDGFFIVEKLLEAPV